MNPYRFPVLMGITGTYLNSNSSQIQNYKKILIQNTKSAIFWTIFRDLILI